TGAVQIYQAILDKPAIAQMEEPAVVQRLRQFQRDEVRHCEILRGYLERLGVTDTDTPSARLATHEAEAFLKLIGEAETSLQLLNILLTIEMMDENAWELLVNLGRDLQPSEAAEEIVATFNVALRDEKEHLRGVRGLVAQVAKETLTAGELEPGF